MADDDAQKLQAAREKQVVELKRRQMLKTLLDDAAYGRIMNIRLANPELYEQLASLIAYLYQQGQLKGKMSEQQLLALLNKVRGPQRETKITIARK